jgi:rSAM/selenodomain-associated transferase 2
MIQIEPDASPAPCYLSIIIPVLDEAEALPGLLASLEGQEEEPAFETVLVDGGSRDGTVERFRALTRDWAGRGRFIRILTTGRAGRGVQMNAGARASRGEAILFLHADTHLRPGATGMIARALGDPRVAGGGFRHRYRDRGVALRLISLYATARSLLRGVHYGDQGLFVRRTLFEKVGGFPDIPLFEDLRLSRAMGRCGRVTTLPLPVLTSARRLRRGGVVRTALQFVRLKIRYTLGTDPARLKADYPDVR